MVTIPAARVLADALAMWRRDGDLLVRLAAPFVALPSLALRLTVPEPQIPDGMGFMDSLHLQGVFASGNAAPLLLAAAVTQFGCAALYAFYCDGRAGDVRAVLRLALRLWPRFLLLALMVKFATFAGLLLLVVPGVIVLGRVLPAAALLVGHQPASAAGAFGRAVRLTAGHTAAVTGLAAMLLVVRLAADWPFSRMDAWLRALHAPNPVALAVIDGAGAGADMLATIADVLVAVALYRALSGESASKGT